MDTSPAHLAQYASNVKETVDRRTTVDEDDPVFEPGASFAYRPDEEEEELTRAHTGPFLIGVNGGTASGKTTVCRMIIEELRDHRVAIISQDSFYRGLTPEEHANVKDYNFDHPDAFDYKLLIETMTKMKTLGPGETIDIPVYDFVTHSRSPDEVRTVESADVIILEGILTFHNAELLDQMHMKIFVDTDDDLRLARRILRDIAERGRDVAGVLHQYERFVKPAYDDFIQPCKKCADVILPFSKQNPVGIDLIVQHIKSKLSIPDVRKLYTNLFMLSTSLQTRALHTKIRDRDTSRTDFVFYCDRLCRLLVEEGLGLLKFTEKTVTTPAGEPYVGVAFQDSICAVSVIRSGEAMENAVRSVCKNIRIGKILIERGTAESEPSVKYVKLPQDIARRQVLLLDPILASGRSICLAVEQLLAAGVKEENIIFLSLIVSPEGVSKVCAKYPRLHCVTTAIDRTVENGMVRPGAGYFGDIYFGTE